MKYYIETLSPLLFQAGSMLQEFYQNHLQSSFDSRTTLKDDGSPVTQADLAISSFLIETLERLYPDIPVVSEERLLDISSYRTYWILDPLDGTRQFLSKTHNFAINLALIEDDQPVLGFIMVPMQDKIYVGCKSENIAYEEDRVGVKTDLRCKELNPKIKLLLGTHKEDHEKVIDYLEQFQLEGTTFIGSSIKFCLMAQGKYDLYLRTLNTGEWDTAAGQAIVEASGGKVTSWDGKPLVYGKKDFINSSFIVKGLWD